jgi:hypothetical protein
MVASQKSLLACQAGSFLALVLKGANEMKPIIQPLKRQYFTN